MRIIILGANGQLGSRLLAYLVQKQQECQVVGCVRQESISEVRSNGAFKHHLIPFNPFTDNWDKFGKADILINCIGIIKETAALDFQEAHVGLTNLMLKHRTLIGNPKIIQVSALGAAVHSPSKFLQTKALADEVLLMHPDTVVVRPSIVCTPNTMLSQKLQLINKVCRFTGGLLPFPAGILQTELQPVTIDDLTELIWQLCLRDDHTPLLEVGGKETYTLHQLLEKVPNCKKVLRFPQLLFNWLYPIISRLFPSLLDKEQQILLQQDNVADTSKCESILGRPMASTAAFWKAELI